MSDLILHPSPHTLAPTLPLILEGNIQVHHIHHFEPIVDMLSLLPSNLNITITRCAMGHPRRFFNWSGCLTLRDQADEDLVPLLRCWLGAYLYVDNCPGFNDAVLDMMATAKDGQYFCAPYMVELDISNCPNVSAAALRRLASARSQVPDEDTALELHPISVSGLAPDISTED
jgi:hypothetical protein